MIYQVMQGDLQLISKIKHDIMIVKYKNIKLQSGEPPIICPQLSIF